MAELRSEWSKAFQATSSSVLQNHQEYINHGAEVIRAHPYSESDVTASGEMLVIRFSFIPKNVMPMNLGLSWPEKVFVYRIHGSLNSRLFDIELDQLKRNCPA